VEKGSFASRAQVCKSMRVSSPNLCNWVVRCLVSRDTSSTVTYCAVPRHLLQSAADRNANADAQSAYGDSSSDYCSDDWSSAEGSS
jgi:hypothetical protein